MSDRYKYLGLPFRMKGLDAGRICGVSIAKASAQPAYSTRLKQRRGALSCSEQESANVDSPTEYGIRYGTGEFKQGTEVAVDKAWYQILRKTLLVPAAASGNAILKVLGVPLCRSGQAN